jgi:hypothetical protein
MLDTLLAATAPDALRTAVGHTGTAAEQAQQIIHGDLRLPVHLGLEARGGVGLQPGHEHAMDSGQDEQAHYHGHQ